MGYSTRYAHLAGIGVTVGEHVTREQRIGRVGCTGTCSGPHLHFEVRRNGSVFTNLNNAYTCGTRYSAGTRIQAAFPDLTA